jgi:co-chaperonin GroES (HSP10)
MKLRLAPGKIAVKKVEAKLKGGLELPVSRAKTFDIAEVTCAGNLDAFGYQGKEKTVEGFKPGDLVLFQVPAHIGMMTAHRIKGVLNLILNATDIVARLDSTIIEMKSFHIAGRYVLLRPQVRNPSSIIQLPDTADEMKKESLHFVVLQKGKDVTIDVETGQEVFPNKGRVNTIIVDNEEVAFVDEQFIDGVLTAD